MRKVLLLLGFLPILLFGQGVLHSRIHEPRDTVYQLEVWYLDWDSGLKLYAVHPFRISTTTYFSPGEYVVAYYRGDVMLLAEKLHIPHSRAVWNFLVMDNRPCLSSVSFVRRKKKEGLVYLDY